MSNLLTNRIFKRLTGVRHILHQPVCDGVDRMTFGRMDDDAGLLVDDQQIVILIYRIDRDILRRKIAFSSGRSTEMTSPAVGTIQPGSAVR